MTVADVHHLVDTARTVAAPMNMDRIFTPFTLVPVA